MGGPCVQDEGIGMAAFSHSGDAAATIDFAEP
jgi:hypothetical protein